MSSSQRQTFQQVALEVDRECEGCPRIASIGWGLNEYVTTIGPMTDDDAEELALIACAGCVSDVQCEQGDRPGIGRLRVISKDSTPCE